jgi:hypothetical protein
MGTSISLLLSRESHCGRVERWRAHGSVRWLVPGFRRGPQSGSHGAVSNAPPKIPYGDFSPVRLQAKACCHQPCPSRRATEVKHQVCLPSGTSRFDMTFVAYVPPADSAGPVRYRPASGSLSSDHLGPRALRSERVVMSLPSSLIRPDPSVSTTPPDFPRTLVIQEASPDDLVWAAAETFPALGQYSIHACHHLYAGRRSRSISPMSPCPHRLPHQTNESAPPLSRPRLPSGGAFRRFY